MYGAIKSSNPAARPRPLALAALGLTLLLPLARPAGAAEPRSASIVVDANTGSVLYSKSADEAVYPASLTKMMTLYMTFELIELGRLDYASKIKMTEEGAAAAPSKLDLKPGEELTVLEAIKALVTKSANDVAIALAQRIGGTEANFARLMTKKARDLGMTHTTFRNASGLPDPGQTTTARDIVTLGLRLQDDFPRHYRLFATRAFTFKGKTYRNHNGLLARYRGTDGIKTGYTRASGFNLVSSVRRDGKHLVAAVFGGDTARERNATMQVLLNRAFPKASTTVTRKPALVARAPQPERATPPVRLAGSRPRSPEPPAPTPAPHPPPSMQETETAIAVAKVRPVLIAMDDERGAQALQTPDATPRFAVASTGGDLGFPRFVPETGALRPSTLEAQAASLERGQEPAAPAAPLRAAPAPRERAAARGPFEIQIGAYGDSAEAERRMSTARQRVGGLLDNYRAVAMPVKSGGGQLYRARFRGFDATAANETCSRLKSLQIDCFVVRTE